MSSPHRNAGESWSQVIKFSPFSGSSQTCRSLHNFADDGRVSLYFDLIGFDVDFLRHGADLQLGVNRGWGGNVNLDIVRNEFLEPALLDVDFILPDG